jgi:DNA polymerase-3 subunit delta'
VPALDTAAVEQALVQKAKVQKEQAKSLATISEGNYREALHLLQHADEDYHALLRDWMKAINRGPVTAQVKCIEELARLGREGQKQFLRYFTHLIEQAIRLRVHHPDASAQLLEGLSDGEKIFVPHLNKTMTVEQQEAISEELNSAAYYIERNANAKILFHALTIKLFHIVKNNAVITVS